MNNGLLLWVDDEIDMLRPHIIFLQQKGYAVETTTNGTDALEMMKRQTYDLVLLDEMMPGLTGLDVLPLMKELSPNTPIVMVTKSEEEDLMNQAIGSKIADYLIKPVNPHQILLSLKKNIHRNEIVTEVTQSGYRQEYTNMSQQIARCNTIDDWISLYKKLVHWELELDATQSNMTELLTMQKEEANNAFAKFVKTNYLDWMTRNMPQRPLMSHDVMKTKVFPLLDQGEKVVMLVIDNFRFDHWKTLSQELAPLFEVNEELYTSILPTATQYARNAIFSGLMPTQIAQMFPQLWVDEDEEEGKNLHEEALLQTLFERYRKKVTFAYHKIYDSVGMERFIEKRNELMNYDLNVVVVNFIDMLSHARTESKMVRELANNEAAYRSIALSWFKHAGFTEVFQHLAQTSCKVVLTTDHGSIRATKPVKIIGDKNTNTNLRYKYGKNLNCTAKDVFVIKQPAKAFLPAPNLSTSYVFATSDSFLAYPNNYNYYVSFYKDTFQHGGISMEEMLVPLITLTPKKR